MGNVLIYLHHDRGSLPKASLALINAGKELKDKWKKEKLIGLCVGQGANAAAHASISYGLDLVLYSTQPIFEKYLSIPYASAVIQVCNEENCDVVVGVANSIGKDFIPRVAVELNAGQASEIIGVNDDGTLKRLMYAGDVLADIEICSDNRVVTVRSMAFPLAKKNDINGKIRDFQFQVGTDGIGEVVSYNLSESERPDLLNADRVVSGGRGLKSAESFEEYIFPLADALGAAVGASRVAVDSGYAPNDCQVGQTGKVVAPDLYLAVGISGAVQHLSGIKDAKVIVAINKDDEAPIFEVADYFMVADLYDVVPDLVEEINRINSK